MDRTWVLIADAQRARCFERHDAHHSLTELADFLHPHNTLAGQAAGGDLTGAAGKGHGRTGHAGTQFEPHIDASTKELGIFAHELAAFLNEGVIRQKCEALVLITTSPLLGELRPLLSTAAHKALKRCVVSDLTHYTGPELKKHVDHALALPD